MRPGGRRFTGKCKLGKMAEFPVTMDRMSPEIVAKINGTDVKFIFDSGSFYSSLDAGSAAAFGLHLYPAPVGFYGQSIGGIVTWSLTKVTEFALPRGTLHNLEFLVGGSHVGGQAVGVIGRNILQIGDAEYDFAGVVARLIVKPRIVEIWCSLTGCDPVIPIP